MNISFQAQQQNNSTTQHLTALSNTSINKQQNPTTSILANTNSQPKTVFESVFNLGQKLITTGKAKFSDYASAAFDLAKGFLKESSWLQNSSSVLARAAGSALEADNWKDGLKNAGKVVFNWGKSYLPDFLGKFF